MTPRCPVVVAWDADAGEPTVRNAPQYIVRCIPDVHFEFLVKMARTRRIDEDLKVGVPVTKRKKS